MKIKTRITLLLLLVAVISLGGCMMTEKRQNEPREEESTRELTWLERAILEVEAQAEEFRARADVYIKGKYPEDTFTLVMDGGDSANLMSFYYESERFPDESISVIVSLKEGEYHYNDDYVKYSAGEDFANKLEPQLTQIFGEEYRVHGQFTDGDNTTNYDINTTAEEYIAQSDYVRIWLQIFIKERPEEGRIVLEKNFLELILQVEPSMNVDTLHITADIHYVYEENWDAFNIVSLGDNYFIKRRRLMRGTHNIGVTRYKNGELKSESYGEWEGEDYERPTH